MIPFEIEYVRPSTADEAVSVYREAAEAGRSVRYLSGGTELVTMARDRKLSFDVLIDLKRIPETTVLDDASLTYGACVRLSQLADRSSVPLLGRAAGGVADRTVRNSITLGGNICGDLPYREAVLPFLLFDGTVTVAGPDGQRTAPLADVFDKRLKLKAAEFVLSFTLGSEAAEASGFYRRRTRDSRVDYPLVTLCMARVEDRYRLAVGGAFGYPVRNRNAEAALAAAIAGPADAVPRPGPETAAASAAARAADAFPDTYWSDLRGSGEYRKALLKQSIREGLEALGGPS